MDPEATKKEIYAICRDYADNVHVQGAAAETEGADEGADDIGLTTPKKQKLSPKKTSKKTKPPPFSKDEPLPAGLEPTTQKLWNEDDKGCVIMATLYQLIDVEKRYDSEHGVPTEVIKDECHDSRYLAASKFVARELSNGMIVNNGWDGRKTLMKKGLVEEAWGKNENGNRGKVYKLTNEGRLIVRSWEAAGLVEF